MTYDEAKAEVLMLGPQPGQMYRLTRLAGKPTIHVLKVAHGVILYRMHSSALVRKFSAILWLEVVEEQGIELWQ